MIAAFKNRIPLSPGYHAEPGETRGHLHDVYTTRDLPKGMKRVHVGSLTKDAVEAWRAESAPRKIKWEDGVVSSERSTTAAAAVAQGVAKYVDEAGAA